MLLLTARTKQPFVVKGALLRPPTTTLQPVDLGKRYECLLADGVAELPLFFCLLAVGVGGFLRLAETRQHLAHNNNNRPRPQTNATSPARWIAIKIIW